MLWEVATTMQYFNRLPLLPDTPDTTLYDHPIVSGQFRWKWKKGRGLSLGYEGAYNLDPPDDLAQSAWNDQGIGHVVHLIYGGLKKKGDWKVGVSLAYLEKFATIDYFAQNDWARWDHSSVGSADGSLTNMQGARLTVGWMALDGFDVTLIGYSAERIRAEGPEKQRGDRLRLDFTWKF